jgi:hypothetical protein
MGCNVLNHDYEDCMIAMIFFAVVGVFYQQFNGALVQE